MATLESLSVTVESLSVTVKSLSVTVESLSVIVESLSVTIESVVTSLEKLDKKMDLLKYDLEKKMDEKIDEFAAMTARGFIDLRTEFKSDLRGVESRLQVI